MVNDALDFFLSKNSTHCCLVFTWMRNFSYAVHYISIFGKKYINNDNVYKNEEFHMAGRNFILNKRSSFLHW